MGLAMGDLCVAEVLEFARLYVKVPLRFEEWTEAVDCELIEAQFILNCVRLLT